MSHLGPDYSPTAGLDFDDCELESRMVWIWGAEDAGPGDLQASLCGTRRDEQQPQPPSDRIAPRALPVGPTWLPQHLMPRMGDPVPIQGTYYMTVLNALRAPYPGYALSNEFADEWQCEMRRLALTRLSAAEEGARRRHPELPAAPILVLAERGGSYAATAVMSLFPRARMIALVGDPRGAVTRVLAGAGPQRRRERHETARRAAEDWCCAVDGMLSAAAHRAPGLTRTVHLEELDENPEAELASLLGWLGLTGEPLPREPARRAASVSRAPVHRWRVRLRRGDRAAIEEIAGERLHRLGYM